MTAGVAGTVGTGNSAPAETIMNVQVRYGGVRLPETRDLFARELAFPVGRERVVEAVGECELEAPNGADTTVASVLSHCAEGEFESADELYDSVVMHVGDGFVGRKRYDDRGGQPRDGEEELSF
jgi:hypothetical protein